MKQVRDEAELSELIVHRAAAMPPQQKALADYLLEHMAIVPFQSVPELAQRTGVSEATVVRFAQRLGYNGFSELKMALVELLQQRLAPEHGDAATTEVSSDVLESVAGLEIANIERSLTALDRSVFRGVAEAIFGAESTLVFGMGVSAYLADLSCYTLTQVGVRARVLSTRFSSPREQLVTLRPADLVLGLSFPPYSRQTLDILSHARELGATTVAVTDRLTAPAAGHADWVLPVRSDNMMFTNAVAVVTVLFNALATEIATHHREEALEAFARINRVLSEEPDVLPPGR